MKIVDRYIFKKFLTLFFLIYISLFLLFVVIDMSANLGDFLAPGVPAMVLALRILQYYALYFFRFADMVFPMLIFGSAAATIVYMWNRNEIIALLATGISPLRILAPIFVGAACITAGFTAVRELYVPAQLINMGRAPKEFALDSDEIEVHRTSDDRANLSIDGDAIQLSTGVLSRPKVMLGAGLNVYGNRIIGKAAEYMPPAGPRPGGWLFTGVTAPAELLKNPSLKTLGSDEPVIYTPYDTPWLEKDAVFVETHINPTHMCAGDSWNDSGRMPELLASLKDPTFGGRAYKIAIRAYSRMLRPICDLFPALIGAPFAFLGRGRSIYVMLIYGAILAAAYVATQFAGLFLGELLLIPAIAVWGPAAVFTPIAANIFSDLMRKSY